MAMSTITVRVDSDLKKAANHFFDETGLPMSTAINVFLRRIVHEQAFPFTISLDVPNAETRAAMEEAMAIANNPNAKGYDDVDEMLRELKKD